MLCDRLTIHRRVLRDVQRNSFQGAVQSVAGQARCNAHGQAGRDGEQAAVEESVDVRAQHQSLFDTVPLRVGEWAEMRSFQDLCWRRACDGADEPVFTDQGPAESVLPSSSRGCRSPATSRQLEWMRPIGT